MIHLVAGFLLLAMVESHAQSDWVGSLSDTNWSDPFSWSPAGAPDFATNVVFNNNSNAPASPGVIDNIVDGAFFNSISSLSYSNWGAFFHTTFISDFSTLSIVGPNGLVGGSTTVDFGTNTSAATNWVAITGTNGTLQMSNSLAALNVGFGSTSSSGPVATLDMSGLGTFNATMRRLFVGIPGVNRAAGVLYLAMNNYITNLFLGAATIETSTAVGQASLDIGDANGNTGVRSVLYLGQQNYIYGDTIAVARQKQSASMLFNPAFTNSSPYAYFRGPDGSSPVSIWSVGDGGANGGTTSPVGSNDFTGGYVDALIGTMNIGRASTAGSGTNGATGSLTFNDGTISVGSLFIGRQPAANSKFGIGTVNVNDSGVLLVATNLGLGLTTGGNGQPLTWGALNVDGGTVLANSLSVGAGASNIITLNNAMLAVTNTFGGGLQALGITNSTLQLSPTSQNATNATVALLGTGGTSNTISIFLLPPLGAFPAQFPLINYASRTGFNNFMVSLPPASPPYQGYITESNSTVLLILTDGPILAPLITSQPTNQTVPAGATATFSVTATSPYPATYQWQLNGVNLADSYRISGSQTPNLVIAQVQLSDAGNYQVIVSNPYASVTSTPAGLLVTCPTNPPSPTGPALIASAPNLFLSKAGKVNAMVLQDDGHIIIGGSFTAFNGFPLTNLARMSRDGLADTLWNPGPNGEVKALAISGTNLFVAGSFSQLGGQFRTNLALLSTVGAGAADPTWNPNPAGNVTTIALGSNYLFAAGDFTSVGGQSRTNVAKLNATSTGAADPAWNPAPNGSVNAIAISGTNIYLGGIFTQLGATSRKRIAKLSTETNAPLDANWSPGIDTAVTNVSAGSGVSSLLLDSTNLYFSGVFTNVVGSNRVDLARVGATGNGTLDPVWNPQLATTNGNFALAVSGTNLFVGGQFTSGSNSVAKMGKLSTVGAGTVDTTWAPTFNSPVINTFLVDGSWLFVGGAFSVVNNAIQLGTAKLDVQTGASDEKSHCGEAVSPGTVNAIVIQANGSVIIGGDFWLAGLQLRPNLARIDSSGNLDPDWLPAADGPVNALALNGTNLYVGGSFAYLSEQPRNGLAKMDTDASDAIDTNWVPTTATGASVYALAVDSTNLYVGGNNLGIGGQSSLSFARASTAGAFSVNTNWNGVANGPVRALLLSQDNNIFVGGQFTNLHGQARTALAKFPTTGNGAPDTNWNVNITGSNNPSVFSLLLNGSDLFVGGFFDNAGGQSRLGLAKASALTPGTVDPAWNPAVSNVLGRVSAFALGISGDYLDVGGIFGTRGVSPINLARVSLCSTGAVDSTWHPNPDGAVQALAVDDPGLYVGGHFQRIGGSDPLGSDAYWRGGFALTTVVGAPVLTTTATNTVVILPSAADDSATTYFQITSLSPGQWYLSDGTTPVKVGDFITVAQGRAGLIFVGTNGTISVVGAVGNIPSGAGSASNTLNLGSNAPPVFSFDSPTYSVPENAGSVTVTVVKQGSGAATVNYSTADGTAIAGRNYVGTSGFLSFNSSDTNKTINIGILDDNAFNGKDTFTISLTISSNNAVLGYPAVAGITIQETDLLGPTTSYATNHAPTNLPPSLGGLIVYLQPALANGNWQLEGERTWHASGSLVSNLVSGNYRVQFQPRLGYIEPDDLIVPIISGQTNQVTNSYTAVASAGVGSITAQLFPSLVATNLSDPNHAQWRVFGTTNWSNTGDTITNLSAGWYQVEFKDITNYATPQLENVLVFPNEGSQVNATYLLVTETGTGSQAQLQPFTSVTNSPYFHVGQIRTDWGNGNQGYGSGVVVKDRVVLTVADLLFDDYHLAYASRVLWFLSRYPGVYEPAPQTVRGWYVYSGYASQRQADNSPGSPSLQSQNLDFAAMFLFESAGRGGFNGYLVGGATNWLTSGRQKVLAGYPMEGVAPADQGKLFATTNTTVNFSQTFSNVYATADIRGYPGMRGGPLEVLYDDGFYYPAAIYLGPSQSNTLVRQIDASAASVINYAVITSVTSPLFSRPPGLPPDPDYSAGVTLVMPYGVCCGGCIHLTVNLGPANLLQQIVQGGGGWYIDDPNHTQTQLNSDVNHPHMTAVAYDTICGAYALQLKCKCVPGFGLPSLQNVPTQFKAGQDPPPFALNYLPAPTNPVPTVGMTVTRPPAAGQPQTMNVYLTNGPLGYTFTLEYTNRLSAPGLGGPRTWTTLATLPPISDTHPLLMYSGTLPNPTNAFFRARWVSCSGQ